MTNQITFDASFEMIPNPSKDYVKSLKKKQKRNNGHCISQPSKAPETKCPCDQYRNHNTCLCGMYVEVPVYKEDME